MNSCFNSLYKNRRVLVTGHTGFKGSWLSLWLTELGARVIGYSLEPSAEPNLFDSLGLKDEITHMTGDIRDEERLLSVFEKHRPEFVFHLAAQSLVGRSYKEPRLTYDTNIMGTVNVLECVRLTEGVRVCIVVTSDKCYENREWFYGYREVDPMGGYDPYSSSKGCAELITSAYRRSFFNPENYGLVHSVALSSARAGNVIGGGDWGEDRITPDCIRALSRGKAIVLRNPSAIRPWQYVLEPLSGYLRLGELMWKEGSRFSDSWNFGPGDGSVATVEELVKLVLDYWGSGSYTTDTSGGPHEAGLLKLDASKARMLLGWCPVYDLREAVQRTTSWYKSYYSGVGRLYELTAKEIWDYADQMSDRQRGKASHANS